MTTDAERPEYCSHCRHETPLLTDYSQHSRNGEHWLCRLCKHTLSASRLGAGGHPSDDVTDIAAMLNVLFPEEES